MGLAAIDRDWSRRLRIGPAPDTASMLEAGRTMFDIPEDLDWFLWRFWSRERPQSIDDLVGRWTFVDMLDQHVMLDAMEAAEAKAHREIESKARK